MRVPKLPKNIINFIKAHELFCWTFIVFIVWNILLYGYEIVAIMRIPLGEYAITWKNILISTWHHWDGGHYLSIAENGYQGVQYAFFPLLPLLIKGLHAILGHSYALSGLIVTRLFAFGALYMLLRLAHQEYDSIDKAKRIVIYLLAFPTAFFLFSVYTEPVFLFFIISAFFFARKGNWLLAGIFSFFAALTRITGMILLPVLLLEYLDQIHFNLRKIRFDVLYLGFCLLGIGAYMVYCYVATNNPLEFLAAQKAWTDSAARISSPLPWTVFITETKKLIPFRISGGYSINLLDYSAVVLTLITICAAIFMKSIRKSCALFVGLSLLLAVMSGSFVSMIRYVITIFPIFLVLGEWGKHKAFEFAYLFIALMLQANLIISFIYSWWVA